MDRINDRVDERMRHPSMDEELEEKEINVLDQQVKKDTGKPKSIAEVWSSVQELKTTYNGIKKEVKALVKSNEALNNTCNLILSKILALENVSVNTNHFNYNTHLEAFNNIRTMVIDISDDDEEADVSPLPTIGKFENGPRAKSEEKSSMRTFELGGPSVKVNTRTGNGQWSLTNSNYRRGIVQQKTLVGEISASNIANIMKKLNFNESPTAMAFKMEPAVKLTPRKRSTVDVMTTNDDDYENVLLDPCEHYAEWFNGSTLPKSLPTKFSPTADMQLTPEEAQLSLYIFYMHGDPSELLMKSEQTKVYRRDFECLCPGNKITCDMITFMARKCTWMQQHVTLQTTWSLPPKFAQDIIDEPFIGDLISDYVQEWMQPFKDLKQIYIPIEDIDNLWYLMVVSIDQQVIYHLDSHLNEDVVHRRHATMRKIGDFISQIVATNYYPPRIEDALMNLAEWEIMKAPGLPNIAHLSNNNSAIWVMDWMNMEHCFHPKLYGKLNEDVVRMRIALELVLGDHNEMKTKLEEKVETFCELIGYNHAN
ncbi:Papain-like cysteine peptidase superfamily [Sesbania bispinosa]|nr:Papain-like cysteine peptidase superfamily [Sesbania bispinosa]